MTDACKNRDSLSVPDESADDFVSSIVKLTVGAGTASVFLPFYSDKKFINACLQKSSTTNFTFLGFFAFGSVRNWLNRLPLLAYQERVPDT